MLIVFLPSTGLGLMLLGHLTNNSSFFWIAAVNFVLFTSLITLLVLKILHHTTPAEPSRAPSPARNEREISPPDLVISPFLEEIEGCE